MYDRVYREIKVEGVPMYLRGNIKENESNRIARYRLGYEMRGERYWMEENKRVSKICGWAEENWEHVLERCINEGGRGRIERLKHLLREGRGEEWLTKIDRWRK